MKTFLTRSILGIFFGAFLSVAFTFLFIYTSGAETLGAQIFVKNTLGSIFSGWFFTVSPLYFENEKLSLAQQTAAHFITVAILYFIVTFGLQWIPFSLRNALLVLLLFVVVYTIIWLSFYLYFRKQAEKLNAELAE